MLADISQGASLVQGHRLAVDLDLAANGLTDRLGHDPGQIFTRLVILPSKQLPETGHNISQKQVHGVIGYQLGPDFPQVIKGGVARLRLRSRNEEKRVSLKALSSRQRPDSRRALARSACLLHPVPGLMLVAVRNGVALPRTSKRRCLDG